MTTLQEPPRIRRQPLRIKCRDGSEPDETCRQAEEDAMRELKRRYARAFGNRKILTYVGFMACVSLIDPEAPEDVQEAAFKACRDEYGRARGESWEIWTRMDRWAWMRYRWRVRRNCCGTDDPGTLFETPPDEWPTTLAPMVAPWEIEALPADVAAAPDTCTATYLSDYADAYLWAEELFLSAMIVGGAYASDAAFESEADGFLQRVLDARQGYIDDVRVNCLDGA